VDIPPTRARAAGSMSDLQKDLQAIGRIGAVPTILRVVSEITGLRFTAVARVTDATWHACAVQDRLGFGMQPGDPLDVATTICSEVRDSGSPIVIEHASQEPVFCDHPTPKMYGFESYFSFPIYRADGEYFGTLCGLDANPAKLRDGKTTDLIRLFAEMISLQLTAEEASLRDREALARERELAELREEFMAVLGHDLRSPLAAILGGASFLLDLDPGETERTVLETIESSGQRMHRLIDDIMDFARGRLGGGFPIRPEEHDVGDIVADVAGEMRSAHPDREILVHDGAGVVAEVDRPRFVQMLTNLVGNALEHSPSSEPVEIEVMADGDLVRIAVINAGETIPAEALPRLFEPYFRSGDPSEGSGLGLGLYIAAEIARAHGGEIRAESGERTTFTVELPQTARLEPGGNGDGTPKTLSGVVETP
jgi:signal transduction histidine kinase